MSEQFLLGGTLPIHRLGFGAMRLPTGGFRGKPRDPVVGLAVLRRAIELGADHIDTAAFYQRGDGTVRANALIRDALFPYAPGLVIATKVGPVFGPRGHGQLPPSGLRAAVEDNLETLGVDHLDLVYLRIGGMEVPHGESVAARFEALAALREEGLIRHLGLSNVDLAQLEEARAIDSVVAVQNNFHVSNRDDTALLEVCAADGISFVPFFPLGGGDGELDNRHLAKVAKRHDATPQQIALAWLLRVSPVTLAIPGTGSLAHLEENMAAGSIALTDDDLTELRERRRR
jgi:pyridoxine 4-dehydrogenase